MTSFRESDRDAQRVRFLCSEAFFLLRVFVAKSCLLGARASASKREAPPTEFSASCVCLWSFSTKRTCAIENEQKRIAVERTAN